tara:strand:+ start:318 stop:689 length:372 start_codon:yes stop_codon:yes gene_type:complete
MDGAEFPYSVGPEDKPINFHMNVQDQISMYKDNEKHQKAPPILPFELEPMTQELCEVFSRLANIRNMLARAVNQPVQGDPTELPFDQAAGKINKGAVQNITDKIDQINELILDIPDDLAKIAI